MIAAQSDKIAPHAGFGFDFLPFSAQRSRNADACKMEMAMIEIGRIVPGDDDEWHRPGREQSLTCATRRETGNRPLSGLLCCAGCRPKTTTERNSERNSPSRGALCFLYLAYLVAYWPLAAFAKSGTNRSRART